MLRIVAGGLRVLVDTAVGITVPDPRGPEGHVSPPPEEAVLVQIP